MTNAEKLAKNTTLMVNFIYSYCESRSCSCCPLKDTGACPFRKVSGVQVSVMEWLEQETKDEE